MTSEERQRLIADLQREAVEEESARPATEEQQAQWHAMIDALIVRCMKAMTPNRKDGPPTALERCILQAVLGQIVVEHIRRTGVSMELPGVSAGYLLDMLAQSCERPGEE